MKLLPAWNVSPLSMLYCSAPVPPLAVIVMEPLLPPKQVTSAKDVAVITGAAALFTVALTVEVHPFAS